MIVQITKRQLLLLAVLPLVVFLFYILFHRPIPSIGPEPQEKGANAAMTGVTAIYSVDYRLGIENWISKVCSKSTQRGCDIFRKVYAPGLWKNIETNKAIYNCTVKAVQIPQGLTDQSTNSIIWELEVSVKNSNSNTEDSSKQIVYALVKQEKPDQWTFERVLTNQEIKAQEEDILK
jgi:hypothetical protein